MDNYPAGVSDADFDAADQHEPSQTDLVIFALNQKNAKSVVIEAVADAIAGLDDNEAAIFAYSLILTKSKSDIDQKVARNIQTELSSQYWRDLYVAEDSE